MQNKNLKLTLIYISIFLSHSYGQWVTTRLTINEHVQSFAIAGSNIFAGTSGAGVFLSTDSGTSWKAVNKGLTNLEVFTLAVSGGTIFAGTMKGVFHSTDTDTELSWETSDNELSNIWIKSSIVCGSNIFVGTEGAGVFLSKNNGESWTPFNNGLTGDKYVFALAAKDSNLIAGTSVDGIFLSTNNGAWTAINHGLKSLLLATLAIRDSSLFAGTFRGVFISVNNGTSWTEANNGLTSKDVRAIAVQGNNLFAGTSLNGIFISKNNGATWTQWGLNDKFIFAIAVGGGNIYAGGLANCVWRRPLSDISDSLPQHKENKILQKNVINNPSTSLHSGVLLTYQIPAKSFVQLGIYTISGKKIALLEQGIQNAGTHTVRFDGNKLPIGLYMYRFEAGSYRESGHFTLVRQNVLN